MLGHWNLGVGAFQPQQILEVGRVGLSASAGGTHPEREGVGVKFHPLFAN